MFYFQQFYYGEEAPEEPSEEPSDTWILKWRHPPSRDVILPHLTSFSLTWRHSPSRDVILPHMTSFSLTWRHSPSRDVILPHVTSQLPPDPPELTLCDVKLPHVTSLYPTCETLAWFNLGTRTLDSNNQELLMAVWNQVFFILQYF